jgi:hypothetical protein
MARTRRSPRRACLLGSTLDRLDRRAAYRSTTPLLYGHYWQIGTPTRSSRHTACVDYSAVKGVSLAAYRWSGETELTDLSFHALAAT